MDLSPLTPRPAPTPTWTGAKVAELQLHHANVSYMYDVYAAGGSGRTEGYASTADALRAARNLSRGAERSALAVVAYEGRAYVQHVRVDMDRKLPLHFEAALPARIGNADLRDGARFRPVLDGLVAIVDGSRTVKVGG